MEESTDCFIWSCTDNHPRPKRWEETWSYFADYRLSEYPYSASTACRHNICPCWSDSPHTEIAYFIWNDSINNLDIDLVKALQCEPIVHVQIIWHTLAHLINMSNLSSKTIPRYLWWLTIFFSAVLLIEIIGKTVAHTGFLENYITVYLLTSCCEQCNHKDSVTDNSYIKPPPWMNYSISKQYCQQIGANDHWRLAKAYRWHRSKIAMALRHYPEECLQQLYPNQNRDQHVSPSVNDQTNNSETICVNDDWHPMQQDAAKELHD